MDRATFIKVMTAGAGSFLFSGIEAQAENVRYDLKRIKIYDNYVRGVHFRKNDFLADLPSVNDVLQLEREADNLYDRFAIKVQKDGRFLG